MRVVSLVPSLSETLWEIGMKRLPAGEGLVGITNFCVRPRDMFGRVERVGGTKDPKVARIVELRPDLVVVNKEENRKEDVDALAGSGVPVHVTDIRSIEQAATAVRELGEALDKVEEAGHGRWTAASEALARRIDLALRDARAEAPEPLPVFVPIWKRPWMTLNGDTYANAVLEACGFRNVFAGHKERYPETPIEDVGALGARFALLPTEPYPFSEKHRGEFGLAGIPRERAVVVDGQALTWYGERTPEGLWELRRARAALDVLG